MTKSATCSNERDACLGRLCQPWVFEVPVIVVPRVTHLVALKYHAIDRSAFWLSQSTVYVNVFFAPARKKYKMNDSYKRAVNNSEKMYFKKNSILELLVLVTKENNFTANSSWQNSILYNLYNVVGGGGGVTSWNTSYMKGRFDWG